MKPNKILYTAEAVATGGRAGRAKSSDGALDVNLSVPEGLGGAGGSGTNPEQLFAAGYAACFIGAMRLVAGREQVALPPDVSVLARVGIGPSGDAFSLTAELTANAPGIEPAVLRRIVDAAHAVCPYSVATRGNIAVKILSSSD